MNNINEKTNEELIDIAGEGISGDAPSRKAFQAQAVLTKRLSESIRSLDKKTSYYSDRLLRLTVLLFFIGFIQILIMITGTGFTEEVQAVSGVGFIVFIIWLALDLTKDVPKK